MKAKLHIAVRQYEFLEFEVEAESQAEFDRKVKELSDHYHNFLEPKSRTNKIEKHKLDVVLDEDNQEPIILD